MTNLSDSLPATRKEAKAQGLKHYFTGKPCKNGHIACRQTSKGVCEECHRLYRTSDKGHETQRKLHAKRMATDPAYRQTKRDDSRKHYHKVMKHDEVRMARHYKRLAEYSKENRETMNRARRAHSARNPGYDRIYTVARRANIKHCNLSEIEQAQVRAIYKLRATLTKATGIVYHVDHHIPLAKGGKHEPSNLWVIQADENLRKGAKLPA